MKVIELQYLPQPQYFALLLQEPEIEIEYYEYYIKQTFRNRCRILTANGIDDLTIPVLNPGGKILFKEVRIDHSQKWLSRHLRAIQSAYGKSPFFEFYKDEFFAIIQKKHKYLFDLSVELMTQCLEILDFDIILKFTKSYIDHKKMSKNDLRSRISPKSNPYFSIAYNQVAYQQVFGNNFVSNLSVIDLIFCEGPQAGKIIESGIIKGT